MKAEELRLTFLSCLSNKGTAFFISVWSYSRCSASLVVDVL